MLKSAGSGMCFGAINAVPIPDFAAHVRRKVDGRLTIDFSV